jgi:hypothetical protein
VAVTACANVIKVHDESLETDYPNNYPIDDYHYTIDDVAEFHEAELQEEQKLSAKESYEREVRREIRHSISRDRWDERMSTEERLDNEIDEIDNKCIEDGTPVPLTHYQNISLSYSHYAFKDGKTFKAGEHAMFPYSGTMHSVTIHSSTDNHHTFELGNRFITTSKPLYNAEYTYHPQIPRDPYETTTPDYQDLHWNNYDEFVNQGMLNDKPERDTPILIAEQSGQLTNLLSARYVHQNNDGTHNIRTKTNKIVYNYNGGIYPHVQRFENRADTPFDDELIDLHSSRYKDARPVAMPVVGCKYVHDDWNTDDRKQIVTITAITPTEVTFTRPGPIETHSSTGEFHEPIMKYFHQYDYNPSSYTTPTTDITPGEHVLHESNGAMILSVYGGRYGDGHYLGSPKEQTIWTNGDVFKPLPRYYSENDIDSTDLRGVTRLLDDEHGEIIRDKDIYEMAGADTIKPGRAAMIYEPIQNIMIYQSLSPTIALRDAPSWTNSTKSTIPVAMSITPSHDRWMQL